jgi:hypothetical protein
VGGDDRDFSLSFIGINTSRPSLDQGLRLEDTLLSFENIFLSGKSKIRFLVFTVLPLKLFWS